MNMMMNSTSTKMLSILSQLLCERIIERAIKEMKVTFNSFPVAVLQEAVLDEAAVFDLSILSQLL